MPETSLRSTHEKLGARFTSFGSWDMPLQYQGVVAEHMAVRSSVGVFDVSHLGRFQVAGAGATDVVRALLCNDIDKVDPGRAQYTMALNDHGGVEDDIIVWRLEDERYWVMPNGTNFDEILGRFVDEGSNRLEIEPIRDATVLLAVQGPGAPDVLEQVLGTRPGRFRTHEGEFAGGRLWAAGTGYTGEKGAEIAAPVATGAALLDAILDAGADPCGLGARDTLRLEMGYPLWGQDLDASTTPLEAGLEWVVDWDHEFVGRKALVRQRSVGTPRSLVAFRTVDRRIPRHGYRLRSASSEGTVTSGNYSPILECGIGLGYMSPPHGDDDVEVEIRGRWEPLVVVDLPFIER